MGNDPLEYESADRQRMVEIQYEQAWQRLRQLQNMVWRVPSITAAIDGGLVLVAYRYITDPVIRIGLILVGLFLTIAMMVALIKHRYFAKSTLDMIVAIEDHFDVKHIQIRTELGANDSEADYWDTTTPETWLESQSAARILKYSMIGSTIVLTLLLGYTLSNL